MRILHTVELYRPSVGGAQEVVRRVSEELARRGHEVTVATRRLPERSARALDGVRIEEFDVTGNPVRGYRGEMERYRRFLLEGRFDVMMNYAAQQWATDLAFEVLDRMACRKVLAPCGFSGLYDARFADYFARLPAVLSRYDALVFHSESYRDIEFARAHGLGPRTVIPNGASEQEFARPDTAFRTRYGVPGGVPLLLTVGTHTGHKGHALVLQAFRRLRVPRAVLAVIGNTPLGEGCAGDCRRRARWARWLSLGRKNVLLLDPPRRDVVGAYHAADLFVFGSEIECSPLVLFEAMASRTPFVTTACGNAQEIVAWGGGGLVVPTERRPDGTVRAEPAAMAGVVEDLLMNPEERARLAESGHGAWRQRFTWERIAPLYEDLYARLVRSAPEGA